MTIVRRRLPFEGFLEALCRLSILKALPTAAELAEAEEPDAGSFLINLEESDQVTYAAFLKVDMPALALGSHPPCPASALHQSCISPPSERVRRPRAQDQNTRVVWGEPPRGEAVAVRVEGLIHLIMRRVARGHASTTGSGLHITAAQMKAWVDVHLKSLK